MFLDFIAAVGALAARLLLSRLAGETLQGRTELSNAFVSIRGVREGSALLRTGLSPYQGSAFRSPPLLFSALQPLANHPTLFSAPCILADALSAALVYLLVSHCQQRARHCSSGGGGGGGGGGSGGAAFHSLHLMPSPVSAALLLLWNPFLILTAAAGSAASLAVAAALLAAYGGACGAPALAALGVVAAAYLRPHCALLAVPLALLLYRGPEDVAAAPSAEALAAAHTVAEIDAAGGHRGGDEGEAPERNPAAARGSDAVAVRRFAAASAGFAALAVVASDAVVMRWAQTECQVAGGAPACSSAATAGGGVLFGRTPAERDPGVTGRGSTWVAESYGGVWSYDDLSANIGLWWYFIIEMFPEFSKFFKFVLHSQCLAFAAPLAIRFHHRPLFAFFLQAMLVAMMQPYPLVADVALYVALLPLFVVHTRRAQGGVFLALVMLLAAILGPLTHYQWIHTGSANANFYYAATLTWGGAQVALFLLLINAVIECDRELAGKPLAFRLRGSGGERSKE